MLYAESVAGVRLLAKLPDAIMLSAELSPKLMLPVAVIVPSISILPVPVIFCPFKSSGPPSCGELSSIIELIPNTGFPPAVEPLNRHASSCPTSKLKLIVILS